MNFVWALLIVAAVTAVAVAAMLFVRRGAPEGSRFADGDRASGVFGVLATGFSVLLGFVVFLAFESFDDSRVGAETEALLVVQQFETAQLLPAAARPALGGDLVCYARYVVEREWPQMEDGTQTDTINPWGASLFLTLRGVEPRTAAEQAAYSKWLDQTTDREGARLDRIHGAQGIITGTLWVVLFFTAGVIFVFMLFFADRGERALVQGVLIGSVTAVITATMLVIGAIADPYRDDFGGLRPTAMERTLNLLDQVGAVAGSTAPPPCDASGEPRAT